MELRRGSLRVVCALRLGLGCRRDGLFNRSVILLGRSPALALHERPCVREEVQHIHPEAVAESRDGRRRDVRVRRLDHPKYGGVEATALARALLLRPALRLAKSANVHREPRDHAPVGLTPWLDALRGALIHKRRVAPSSLA